MTPVLLLLAFLIGLVVGYSFLARRTRPKALAIAEYWVYQSGEALPEQERFLDRMVGKNPYKQGMRNPITAVEGLILSDVRFHMALVLRAKNPHVFRPDLFDDVELDTDDLSTLADSTSLVKLRYLSEDPLHDKRHLQFLIHGADAVAELTGSNLIYDCTAQRVWKRPELQDALARDLDATDAALHVRALWKDLAHECRAESRGLRKIGLSEIRTLPMEPDQRVLILEVLTLALDRLWSLARLPQELEVEAYGDRFKLLFDPPKDGYTATRVLRMQGS